MLFSYAQQVTNISETEPLIYAYFDIRHNLEVVLYPDSEKVGIYAEGNFTVFPTSKQVDYHEGE